MIEIQNKYKASICMGIAVATVLAVLIVVPYCGGVNPMFGVGCSSVKVQSFLDITRTISCPIADDITCQHCHAWKIEVGSWGNTKTDKIDKVEIILPIDVNIDFRMCVDTTIVNAQVNGDWVCSHIFKSFKEGYRAVQVLYNRWGLSGLPPSPPLALIQTITLSPYSDDSIGDSSYWIYQNGVPKSVDQVEFEIYILSLQGGEEA